MRQPGKHTFLVALILFTSTVFLHAQTITCEQKDGKKVDWKYYVIKKQDTPESLFGEYWIDVLRFNRVDRNHLYVGRKIKAPLHLEDAKNYTPLPNFYEPAKAHEKYVLISLDDQFLGCYEYGQLKFSFPITSGRRGFMTPVGDFRALARHRDHFSSKYKMEGTNVPYPMRWAVEFKISFDGIGFWIHGRDLPGYPGSHGCIGLSDEEMQKKYYKRPQIPVLEDVKIFYLWLFPGTENDGRFRKITNGAPIRIVKNIE